MAVHFADELGQHYLDDHVISSLTRECKCAEGRSLSENLKDPFVALEVLFGRYAFARRGRDRDDIAHMTRTALRELVKAKGASTVLEGNDGTALWDIFVDLCAREKRKPNEQQNRGPIQGLLELAQEVYSLDEQGSILDWIREAVLRTGRVEAAFERVVDIRGFGPKNATLLLRDMVAVYDLEDELDRKDHVYLQPIDRWVRLLAAKLDPEVEDNTIDWIVAGKMSKLAHTHQVSVVKLNMGATYFGQKSVRQPERYDFEYLALQRSLA